MSANRISPFLRSQRDCWKASVRASARTRSRITHEQHPDHQHRIDRGSTGVRVVRCKLLVHPTQIENGVDLAHHMVRRHHLIEIKAIKELTLTVCSAPLCELSRAGAGAAGA